MELLLKGKSQSSSSTLELECKRKKEAETEGALSCRGIRVLNKVPYGEAAQAFHHKFADIWTKGKLQCNKYDPETNHDGFVATLTAENRLSYHIIDEALRNACLSVPPTSAGYDMYRGNVRFRKTFAAFFEDHIFTDDVRVDPEHLAVGAGVASMVDATFSNLIDQGDGVLVPVPCYTSHERNLTIRSGASFISVPTERNNFIATSEMLACAAWARSA